MKKLTLLIVLLFTFAFPLLGQEDNVVEYGDTATGEITNREFEIEYSFSGAAGDVVSSILAQGGLSVA